MIDRVMIAALIALAAMPLRAQTADIAARIELHALPTQTLSDRDFLTGKDGKPATITGELRIALMGFSRGGQAVLFASEQRFHKLWNKSGAEFAAYIPLYPDCSTTYVDDTTVVARPIRIFYGAAGDHNPVASCKRFVERLGAAGRDVELTEYPDAHHGYDTPLGSGPVVSKRAQTVRNCSIVETADGVLINAATNAPFSYRDACVQLDPQVGRNAAAAMATQVAVAAFVRTLFALKP